MMESDSEAGVRVRASDRSKGLKAHMSCSLASAKGENVWSAAWAGYSTRDSEDYEIGIGGWKATIVKQIDGPAGKVSYRARFEALPKESWTRRRRQRTLERLNARRRSAN